MPNSDKNRRRSDDSGAPSVSHLVSGMSSEAARHLDALGRELQRRFPRGPDKPSPKCEWYVLCRRPAATRRQRPDTGEHVLICDRCDRLADQLNERFELRVISRNMRQEPDDESHTG